MEQFIAFRAFMVRQIIIHRQEDFIAMRRAGRLAAELLDYLTEFVMPKISTEKLNQLAHEFIIAAGAYPAPLHYRGFPKSICTSVNHVVCHGIPDTNKILQNGDIVNIDVTVRLDGWHGDSSRMFWVGDKVPLKAKKLIDVTYQAMLAGINAIKPGARLGDIGAAIETLAHQNRYAVVKDFCGHGIGRNFHDEPNVLHYGVKGTGVELLPGMFFTIEPMFNIGTAEVKVLQDGWTAVTRDKSLSAQFEHTVGVTDSGVEIFTLSPKGWHYPEIYQPIK